MKQRLPILFLSLFLVAGLSAQTHFPVYNPSYHYNTEDTDKMELLAAKWNTALNEVKQKVNASNESFEAFSNYYRATLDSEHYVFFKKVRSGKITFSNVNSYIKAKKQTIQNLYNNYSNVKSKFKSPRLAPSYTPPSCEPSCTNMDFSTGDLTGWYGYYATDNSVTSYTISGMTGGYLGAVQKAAYDPITSTYQIHITQAAANDWFLNTYHAIHMSQGSPWGHGYSVMIGDSIAIDAQVATLSQEFEVTPTTNSITYAYSVFLDNPGHSYYEQPFFSVTLFDSAGDTIKGCGEYDVVSAPGLAGFRGEYDPGNGDTIYWKDWTQVNVSLGSYVGQCVTIQFQVSDCEPTGHFGYAYVDASCNNLIITASSPTGTLCGKNGTIDLYGPPGEAGYSWSGPAGGIITNDTLQNIVADSLGTYTLVITAAAGEICKDTLTFKVSSIDTIKASAAIVNNIKCSAGTGSAQASETNGLGPFVYSWSPTRQTTALATGLTAGSYTVTITDSNGCSATADVSLTEPPPIVAITSFTAATCANNNGIVSVTASGGATPYTYLWNPGGNTNARVTGLSGGTYTVTVSDANGCTTTAAVNVPSTAVVVSISASSPVSCFGGNNGSATGNVRGGISPYVYIWTPSGQTNLTAIGLSAGTYTIKVTDNVGCTGTAAVTITQPPQLIANAVALTYPQCNGGTGSASASASGGVSPYTYSWNPSGQTTATATGLVAAI